MKKFAILGSCLTNIPGVFLGNEYSWNRLNNAVVPSAKHFVDYYIDGTRTMPPLGDLIGEFRLENPALTAEDRECITEWVTENYRDHIGLRGLPKSQPNLFENLENEVFDAILFDNLLDLRIPYWNYVGNNLPPFSFTFPVKDKRVPHIHDDFVEAPRPTPTEAADDWMRIVDYVRERQPSARLFFFCAPVVTNEGRPALQQAAWEFYLRFSTLARSRDITVVPPLDIPRELTKLPQDQEHLDTAVYKAMAGHIYLSAVSLSPFTPHVAAGAGAPRAAMGAAPQAAAVPAGPRRVERSLRAVIAGELGLAAGALTERSGINETPGWDSLKQFAIILLVEAAFGVRFSFDQTVKATSVAAIRDVLAASHVHDNETAAPPPAGSLTPAPAAAAISGSVQWLVQQNLQPLAPGNVGDGNLFGAFVNRALARPQDRFALLVKGDQEAELCNGYMLALAAGWGRRLSGIQPGSIVAIVLDHSEHLYAAFIGCILRGIVPTFLPPLTSKQDPAIFAASMRVLFDRIRPAAVIASAATAAVIPAGDWPILATGETVPMGWDEVRDGAAKLCRPASAGDVAFLQHSSGTTSHKKGVMLSHGAVLRQVAAYGASIGINTGDTIASWLPLYHDMGLISSFIVPVVVGCPIISLDAQEWVVVPTRLFDYVERERAQYFWLPNFAFHHIARADRGDRRWDLRSVKAVINCSEPCRKAAFDIFSERYGPMGLDRGKLQVSYAMAENVFGVTQTMPGTAVRDGGPGPAASYVSCGRPIAGVEIELRDPDGRAAAPGETGEICLRSPYLFDGYFRLPDITAARLKDGWYHTGDIGMMRDGELFVIGRVDDMIIVNGRNLVAHEAEDALNSVPGLHPGRNILFSRFDAGNGSDVLAVLAETKTASAGWPALDADIRKTIFSLCGLPVAEVHLLEPGFLVKSSSGKLARKASIEKFLTTAQPTGEWQPPAGFDLATATPEAVAGLLENMQGKVGSALVLAGLTRHSAGRAMAAGTADLLARTFCNFNNPVSVLDPVVRQAIFQAATPYWKLRMVWQLADADEIDAATHLAGTAAPELAPTLRRSIDLNLARRTFDQAGIQTALEALERTTSGAVWHFLRECIRHDVPGSTLLALNIGRQGERLRLEDLHSVDLGANRESQANAGLNQVMFSGDMARNGDLVARVPFDHVLHRAQRMIAAGDFAAAMDILKLVIDHTYMFVANVWQRRAVAGVVMQAVKAGVPVPTRVLAYLLSELVDVGGWRHAARTLLAATVAPEAAIGPQTYFSLRRACLTAADEGQARMLLAKTASVLTTQGPEARKLNYFANGRHPVAVTRPVDWARDRFLALTEELGIRFPDPAPAEKPRSGPRVAVVLVGQLRSFEGVFNRIAKEVIGPLQADLFINTWDTVGFSLGAHDNVSRLVNRTVFDRLPVELRTREGFTQRFPSAMALLAGPKEDSASVIRATAGDVPHIVVNEHRFEQAALRLFPAEVVDGSIDRIRLNQCKMFFQNRLCAELLERQTAHNGRPYDWVIRMRPDMDVQSFTHTMLTSQRPDDNLVTVHSSHPIGINDQFAFGSARAMRYYMSCFDLLVEQGGFKHSVFDRNVYGEAFLFDCLSYWGVRTSFASPIRYSLNATRLGTAELARLMLEDCGTGQGDGVVAMLRELAG